MANSGDKSDKILAGIQLTLAEIRDIRAEMRDSRADFKTSMEKADADRQGADVRFETLIRRSDRQFHGLVRGVVQVGRDIRDTEERHTRLLEGILKTLRAGFNGKWGNGSPKKK